MQFTQEVNWTLGDFVFMGALLFGSGLAYELVVGGNHTRRYRLGVGLAVVAGFLLVWLNLAVGIIGSEHNHANLLYVGVLAVAAVGTVAARFRPQGMARALFATALVQVAVPVVALLGGQAQDTSREALLQVGGVTALFVALWVGAALLLRRASNLPA